MTSWTGGYVSDIPYGLRFVAETLPAHIAFAAVCVGRDPGLAIRPKRVLELGFGMGGFVINAAANPDTHFEGIDFNPVHVAHARGLVEAAELANVSLREASFQELAREAQEGQHDLDLIVLHGILTWVSVEAQEAIIEIARKRLKAGGVLYVSYNCMPGCAPMLPMQRLMRENAKRVFGGSELQAGKGLELLTALAQEGAGYFRSNPHLEQRLKKLALKDRSYVAHEYLNANWFIFHFADVAEMFGRAKLNFVASAALAENFDALAVPKGLRQRIGSEIDPVFKETLRDIASNKQFRRDVFARGAADVTAAERSTIISEFRFALRIPRRSVNFTVRGLIGEITGSAEMYGGMADLLADKLASFDEVAVLPVFAGNPGAALQTLALFVHSGQVIPVLHSDTVDRAPAQRLNRLFARKMLQGRTYQFVAAPAAGSGIQVTPGELVFLAAVFAGEGETAEKLAAYVVRAMEQLGMTWQKDGKPVLDLAERQVRARAEATTFISDKVPVWRRLGIL